MQALCLKGPTVPRPVLDPLAVLLLHNRLFILLYWLLTKKNFNLLFPGQDKINWVKGLTLNKLVLRNLFKWRLLPKSNRLILQQKTRTNNPINLLAKNGNLVFSCILFLFWNKSLFNDKINLCWDVINSWKILFGYFLGLNLLIFFVNYFCLLNKLFMLMAMVWL